MKIHPEARGFCEDLFSGEEELFRVVDLPPWKVEDLAQIMGELGPKYQGSMAEEIHLMTNIEDLSHTIRNPEVCKVKAE